MANTRITVTITGPQGAGKTMLAMAIGEMLAEQGIGALVLREPRDREDLTRHGKLRHRVEVAGSIEALYNFPGNTVVVIDDSEE